MGAFRQLCRFPSRKVSGTWQVVRGRQQCITVSTCGVGQDLPRHRLWDKTSVHGLTGAHQLRWGMRAGLVWMAAMMSLPVPSPSAMLCRPRMARAHAVSLLRFCPLPSGIGDVASALLFSCFAASARMSAGTPTCCSTRYVSTYVGNNRTCVTTANGFTKVQLHTVFAVWT